MVDILKAAGGEDPRGPRQLSNLPESRVTGSMVAAPYAALGAAFGELGGAISSTGARLSHQLDLASTDGETDAGRADVGRDADGKVTFVPRPLAFSAGDKAYNAAGRDLALTRGQADVKRAYAEKHLEMASDPAGFEAWATKYNKELAATGDRAMRPLLATYGEQLRTQHFATLSAQKVATDTSNAKTGLAAQIQDRTDALLVMSRQAGGTDTDEYRIAVENIQDLYGQLVKNPLYGVPAEKAASDLERIKNLAQAESYSGRTDTLFATGGSKAVNDFVRDRIENATDLKLGDTDRAKAATMMRARLGYLEGERRKEIANARPTAKGILDLWQAGKPVDETLVDSTISTLQRLGDQEGVAELQMGRMKFGPGSLARSAISLTDAQRQAMVATPDTQIPGSVRTRASGLNDGYRHIPAVGTAYEFFTSRGWTPEQSAGLAGTLLHESGFDTNARNKGDGRDGSDSIGIAQWNSARAQALKAYAAQKGKPVTDLMTQLEFVDQELRTTHAKEGAALRAAKTVEESSRAAIGFEKPQNWSEANPAAGHGYANRLRNAENIAQAARDGALKGGVPGAAGLPAATPVGALGTLPYTPEQAAANPQLFPAYVRAALGSQKQQVEQAGTLADAILTGLNHRDLPSRENLASVIETAMQSGDRGLREKVDKLDTELRGYDGAQALGDRPPGEAAALLAAARADVQGGHVKAQAVVRSMGEWMRKEAAAMKADPVAEGANRKWYKAIGPLDFTSTETMSRTLAEHGGAAIARSAHERAPQPIFGPPELAEAKTVITKAPLEKRVMMLRAIASLPDDIRSATLAQLGQSSDSATFAFAGGLANVAPDIARSIIEGQDALKTNDAFAPGKGPQKVAYERDKGTNLPLTAFAPALRVDPNGPLSAMSSAIDARYAHLSSLASDTSGNMNTQRLKQAAADITGGFVTHNGTPVVAPARGMDQRTFDGIVSGLTDQDLAGVTTGNGQPVPAAYVKDSARLQAVGDGQYLVQVNRNDAAPLYAGKGGKPFVLDLRGRKPSSTYVTSDPFATGMPLP